VCFVVYAVLREDFFKNGFQLGRQLLCKRAEQGNAAPLANLPVGVEFFIVLEFQLGKGLAKVSLLEFRLVRGHTGQRQPQWRLIIQACHYVKELPQSQRGIHIEKHILVLYRFEIRDNQQTLDRVVLFIQCFVLSETYSSLLFRVSKEILQHRCDFYDEFATAFTRIGDAGKTLANERRVHFTLVFGAGLGGAKQRRHALVDKRQKLGCLLPYFFVVHWRVLEHLPHNLDAFE